MTRTPILAAFLCAVAAFAQQPNGASLSGRVTDTVGKPIAKATLLLVGGGRGPNGIPNAQPYRATTATDGTYAFTSIQPGAYNLQTYRAGYATGLLGADSPFELTGSLRLAADQQMASVNITLATAATISGRVTDTTGNPVAEAQIALWRPQPQGDGTNQMVRINQISGPVTADAVTDNDGKYAIENVAPGIYYLSAGLLTGGPAMTLFSLQGLSVTRIQSLSPQPEAWVTTWFPHAIDGATASPIEIAAGRTIPVDIQLSKTPVYQIKGQLKEALPTLTRDQGRLIASPPGPPLDQIRIGLLTMQGQAISTLMSMNQKDGSFVLNNAPPGEYYLRATAPGSGSPPAIGLQKVTIVDRNIDVAFNLPVPVEIHGIVTSNAALPPNLALQFIPSEFSSAISTSIPIGSDGVFTLPGFMPDAYRIKAWAFRPNYVKSVTINGAQIAANSAITLPSGSVTMQVTLGSPTGSIRANIQPDATGAIANYVIAVPAAPIPGVDWPLQWYSLADDGLYALVTDLPPGSYRLYAVDAADPATVNADTLKPFDNQSVIVTVVGGDPVNTTLRAIRIGAK